MTKRKLTTYCVNESIQLLERKILQETGISRAAFHRKAVDYLYKSEDRKVHPRLLITEKKNPLYVRRAAKEPVYLDAEMERKLKEIAALTYNHCSEGTVFFHALLIYCTFQYQMLREK